MVKRYQPSVSVGMLDMNNGAYVTYEDFKKWQDAAIERERILVKIEPIIKSLIDQAIASQVEGMYVRKSPDETDEQYKIRLNKFFGLMVGKPVPEPQPGEYWVVESTRDGQRDVAKVVQNFFAPYVLKVQFTGSDYLCDPVFIKFIRKVEL